MASLSLIPGSISTLSGNLQASKLSSVGSTGVKATGNACSVKKSQHILPVRASSQGEKRSISELAASGLAAFAVSSVLQFSTLFGAPALASEANILQAAPPSETHYVDDAGVLNRVTKSDLKRLLTILEEKTGYHIDFVTLRKSSGKGDAFEFADQVLENWYPTIEEGNNKAVVLLITTQKEGAYSGGPAISDAIGEEVIEGILSENLPVLATDEKYNEAIYSTAKRLVARLNGEPDIPGPRLDENKRISNYKTKEETANKRDQFTLVVGGLLAIAFVVPMAQYYAYVAKK